MTKQTIQSPEARMTTAPYAVPATVVILTSLGAALLITNETGRYLLLGWCVLLILGLAYRLRQDIQQSQDQLRRLTELEALARRIIAEPVDTIALPELLDQHVPAIFDPCQVEIRLFPNQRLYPLNGTGRLAESTDLWHQLEQTTKPFTIHHQPNNGTDGLEMMAAPILDTTDHHPIGGICLVPNGAAPYHQAQWQTAALTLGKQIAGAVHRVITYEQALAAQAEAFREEVYAQAVKAEIAQLYQRVTHELALAGRIQNSFLPTQVPEQPGWQIAVSLEPARETSGDFFDFIPLPENHLGILVADVADKGIGAALYMALSRTLIRTYALEHTTSPARALSAANSRILADTTSDMFVTVFYAIVDLDSGRLSYCNAGHNPPFLIQSQADKTIRALTRTALPLGLFEDLQASDGVITMAPQDLLVLYSDGITEAEDEFEDFFGEERLKETASANLGRPVEIVEEKILTAVANFVGDHPQHDDMTLMLLARD